MAERKPSMPQKFLGFVAGQFSCNKPPQLPTEAATLAEDAQHATSQKRQRAASERFSDVRPDSLHKQYSGPPGALEQGKRVYGPIDQQLRVTGNV